MILCCKWVQCSCDGDGFNDRKSTTIAVMIRRSSFSQPTRRFKDGVAAYQKESKIEQRRYQNMKSVTKRPIVEVKDKIEHAPPAPLPPAAIPKPYDLPPERTQQMITKPKKKETKKPVIASLRPPKPASKPKRNRPTRPSLSDQLASIGKAADDITSDIRKTHNLGERDVTNSTLLHTAPSRGFVVGRLRCKYPSPVQFYHDRCVYVFHHPHESKEISMHMFYRDMRRVGLSDPRACLSFKIDHPLVHYGTDYRHTDPQHSVELELASASDVAFVRREILPRIQQHSGSEQPAWHVTSFAVAAS